jgi:hypothetical protein
LVEIGRILNEEEKIEYKTMMVIVEEQNKKETIFYV